MNGDFELVDAFLGAKEKKKRARRRKLLIWAAAGTAAGILVASAGTFVYLQTRPKPPIPNTIKSKVTSTLFVPQGSNYKVDSKSATYDKTVQLLVYNVKAYGTKIVFSEQPTPANFVDKSTPGTFTSKDNSAYGLFIKNMEKYANFNVSAGTVYLTKPPQQNYKQVAIINAKGTLLFAKPNGSLTKSQWQQMFSSLAVLH